MPLVKQFDVDVALGKAMRCFWHNGFEATSVQDLVDVTGVNRGSLYATWGDKRGLFIKSLKTYDRDVRATSMRAAVINHAPLDAIVAILSTFSLTHSGANAHDGCLLANTALELAAHDPEVQTIVAAGQRAAESVFASLLEAARVAGDLPPDIDVTAAARRLLATLVGLSVLVRSRPEPALLDSIIKDAISSLRPTKTPIKKKENDYDLQNRSDPA